MLLSKYLDSKVTNTILNIYQSKSTEFEWQARKASHVDFIQKSLSKKLTKDFLPLDASRPWICYWLLHSLELLSGELELGEKMLVKSYLSDCMHEGAFGGSRFQLAHLASTYAALMCSCIIQEYDIIQREKIYKFIQSLKQSDGSFIMHEDGESDLRATYCALASAYLLNCIDKLIAENVANYIKNCQTSEGGFGAGPGAEAHGGYSYCAIASLCILARCNLIDRIDDYVNMEALGRYMSKMQCKATGAFKGRSNKLVDACYSFWQGSIFLLIPNLLSSTDASESFIKLQRFILQASQLPKGFCDKPGNSADFYHTCYALSGLSIAQEQVPSNSILGDVHLPRIDALINTLPGNVKAMRANFNK